jgi:hypothetical protein
VCRGPVVRSTLGVVARGATRQDVNRRREELDDRHHHRLAVLIPVSFIEVVLLRRRVVQLEKGREVVDRHLNLSHLTWRLDGEPGPQPSDEHLVVSVHEHEEPD